MKFNIRAVFLCVCLVGLFLTTEAKRAKKFKAKQFKLPKWSVRLQGKLPQKNRINPSNNMLLAEDNNTSPRSSIGDSRIVGGAEVVPNSLPWQVGLLMDGQEFCGGTLISEKYVLTAAHCVDGAGTIEVMLGAHNIYADSSDELGRIDLQTNEYIVHPDWMPRYMRNDVALVKLPFPVAFTKTVKPIRLAPPKEYQHAGDKLHISGWGRTSDTSDEISSTLRQVAVVGITNAECARAYSFLQVTSSTICTSTHGGKGSCQSDSGGPLSVVENGIYTQVGIVSFGSADGCEAGYPVAFARISSFTKWISSETGIEI